MFFGVRLMSTSIRFPPPGFDDLSADEKIDYLALLWDRIASLLRRSTSRGGTER
jgi:hypothetical protein